MDIFSKDFLLIPIHGDWHWSLIVVCHPGADFQDADRRPIILHLDSLKHSVTGKLEVLISLNTLAPLTHSLVLPDILMRQRNNVLCWADCEIHAHNKHFCLRPFSQQRSQFVVA